ncbi:hypothetical protein [Moorena producens]|uniref:hypothetical protein n=1 Tax=Moorena producens TaxID=1155739 RepID=UPI000B1EE78C|nr:hypothetical protein [Moorena producens]
MSRPAGRIEYLPWLAMETHQQPPDLAVIQQFIEEANAPRVTYGQSLLAEASLASYSNPCRNCENFVPCSLLSVPCSLFPVPFGIAKLKPMSKRALLLILHSP